MFLKFSEKCNQLSFALNIATRYKMVNKTATNLCQKKLAD